MTCLASARNCCGETHSVVAWSAAGQIARRAPRCPRTSRSRRTARGTSKPPARPRASSVLVKLRQVVRAVSRDAVEGGRVEDAQAVIDVPHPRRAELLIVGEMPAVLELDVAGVPPVLVAVDRHQRRLAAGLESALDGRVVAGQIRIAVEHEERSPSSGSACAIAPAVPSSCGPSNEYSTPCRSARRRRRSSRIISPR